LSADKDRTPNPCRIKFTSQIFVIDWRLHLFSTADVEVGLAGAASTTTRQLILLLLENKHITQISRGYIYIYIFFLFVFFVSPLSFLLPPFSFPHPLLLTATEEYLEIVVVVVVEVIAVGIVVVVAAVIVEFSSHSFPPPLGHA